MMNTDWKRVAHVVNVLFKQGLGKFIHDYGLSWHLPLLKKITPTGSPPPDLPARLRKTMEQLGGAYLKLGQFLALRPDLLPREYCDEFKKLLDEVPQMPLSAVQQVLEKDLKAPSRTFFKHFEPKPTGSASIAQVHKAQLTNNKHVVVKVQRPDARQQFAADIGIMYYIANKIEHKLQRSQAPRASLLQNGLRWNPAAISPLTIVKEFERYTAQELNFVLEAKNIERFAKHFAKSSTVVVPNVHWQATTNRVLTMDYLDGVKLTEVLKNPKQYPRTLLSRRIADAAFDQILELGTFHADLHPGNILVMPGNKIGLLDFGIVGTLSPEFISQTFRMYSALIAQDASTVTKVLLAVGTPSTDADEENLKRDVEHILSQWSTSDLSTARVTTVLQSLFESAVNNRITIPVGFILLGKALVTVEGTCLALDPAFNFVEYSQPKIAKVLREHKQPTALLKRFTTMSRQYAETLSGLPQQASEALERVKKGTIELNIRDTDVKHLGMDLNRSSNRLSFALIIASLLLTGALLVDVPPKIGAYSVFTVIGLFFAAMLLLILVVSVVREGVEPFDPHKEKR